MAEARLAFGPEHVNVIADAGRPMVALKRIMLPVQNRRGFSRRPDRSLGWAAMESKQAAALARDLSASAGDCPPPSPFELLPFPPVSRRRHGITEILKRVLAWILALQLCYLLATSILISVYRYVDPPATVLIAYRKWRFGWKVQAPRPISLKKVPRYIRSMLVAVEDGKFYEHHGIDFEAFQRAREINKRLGKPLYGGSTLTMQVARTLFLVPEKSYVRKYLEVLTALELEAFLPKNRILELYFGYAEWGKGLFGIEAASHKWYDRGISELSRDEAVRLVAILSSPIKYGPDTLQRNGILRERYIYLAGRFNPSTLAAEAETAPQQTAAPTAEPILTAPAPDADQVPPATDRPPPSLEPGAETEAESPAESPVEAPASD
jgi:monofunctional biosynthetic peptidoglycan transglycosylase